MFVALYTPSIPKHQELLAAWYRGLEAHGITSMVTNQPADMAVLCEWNADVAAGYANSGKPFIVCAPGYKSLYTRISLNGRDNIPVSGFESFGPRAGRIFGPMPDWHLRSIEKIAIIGMSAEAAESYGFREHEWEQRISARLILEVPEIFHFTRRKDGSLSCYGIDLAPGNLSGLDFDTFLKRVDLIIAHHGNTGVEALAAGTPYYIEHGLGKQGSIHDFRAANIRNAVQPVPVLWGRTARSAAAAYWTLEEIASGECWNAVNSLQWGRT